MSFVQRASAASLALMVAASATCALAQDSSIGRPAPSFSRIGPPRIEINPRPLFRRCESWYVVQYRPSGRVLFPEKHCWWSRG
jgi:hypothetical protein